MANESKERNESALLKSSKEESNSKKEKSERKIRRSEAD